MKTTQQTTLRQKIEDAFAGIDAGDCQYDAIEGDDVRGGWINATVNIDGAELGVGWWLYSEPTGLSSYQADKVRDNGYAIVPYRGNECAITVDADRLDDFAAALEVDEGGWAVEMEIARIWDEEGSDDVAEKVWRDALADRVRGQLDDMGVGELLAILATDV